MAKENYKNKSLTNNLKLSANKCRFCSHDLHYSVVDLGMSPLCNNQVTPAQTNDKEKFYPLNACVCENCWLMQLNITVNLEELFSDYTYFSSYSASWLEHVQNYSKLMIEKFELSSNSLVAEIASNDGYLLQWFIKKGIPVVGIDPASNIAHAALEKGVRTEVLFFGSNVSKQLVKKYGKADLIVGNNVLAHVPDINDFVSGIKEFLAPNGVITMEFPHLEKLIEQNQFDTIYHEHFSYFSFVAVSRIFTHHGLSLFDVEELSTHGGSLRIYGKHIDDKSKKVTGKVNELLQRERNLGMETREYYAAFDENVKEIKRKILSFLIEAKRQGKRIAGYGAPGKGNTLLNYCGIRTDFLEYTVDMNPHKQGNFLPGTRIPVRHPDVIRKTKPDYLLVLPWNLKNEIIEQHAYIREWGGQFVIPIPELSVID